MKIVKASDLEEAFFTYKDSEEIAVVKEILEDVRQDGDSAVRRLTLKYDGVDLEEMRVNASEMKDAYHKIDGDRLVSSIRYAAENIRRFAERQREQVEDFEFEIVPGVSVGQKVIPIERVGIYVPGGRFPLVSTLLMCAIPAKVAGVAEIVVCSPPSHDGSIHPTILVAADILDLHELYQVGGAQAIAAMAYGTESIRKVDKVVGPGNKYVALAKREVFGIVGIDFIAGPTEIMIIADETANPEYLAADLLAQAEHDVDALPILVTTSLELAQKVREKIESAVQRLGDGETARLSVEKNCVILIVSDLDEAVEVANRRAPEHLEIQVRSPERYTDRFGNYGSLFIGEYSAETLGDYSSGLNHALPTNISARYTGGLSVKDFLKLQTTLRVTKDGLSAIGPTAKNLAEIEGLFGHAQSIAIRMRGNLS